MALAIGLAWAGPQMKSSSRHDERWAGDAAEQGPQVNRLVETAFPGFPGRQVRLHDPAHVC